MKQEELNKERLGKIVALAKNGVGGEKINAINIVKALCKKHHLNFEDVMSSNMELREYTVILGTKEELEIFAFVYSRYGLLSYKSRDFYFLGKKIVFKTTPEKYIEVMNAYTVLYRLYKKERKVAMEAIQLGFRQKHELYYNPTPEEWEIIRKEKEEEKKKTKAEEEQQRKLEKMAEGLSRGMDNANIYKQLK